MEQKKQNTKKITTIGIILLLLLLIISFVYILRIRLIGFNRGEIGKSCGTVYVIDDNAQSKSESVQAAKNPLADRQVYFAGYITEATLNTTTQVYLENMAQNGDFLMKYTVTDIDSGNVVCETNLIRSGKCIIWTPAETLVAGTYHLQILQSPFYQSGDDFIPLTAGSTDVTYTITR